MPIKKSQFTEQELSEIGARLAEIFKLRRSKQHSDRWDIENGDKTNLGLARTFIRIAQEIEDETPPDQIYNGGLT